VQFDPALCGIAQDHGPMLCGIARDHGPALCGIQILNKKCPPLCCIARDHGPPLCGIARDQHIFVNSSANLKQNLKIFYGINQGPRGNRLTKKTEGRKSRDTVPLS
jgi:hypothetical protein